MLCQIQFCYAYCLKHDRKLVLDTTSSGMQDEFSRYLTIESRSLTVASWSEYKNSHQVDGLSVFPAILEGRIDTYETDFRDGSYIDLETSTPLGLDFSKSYKEDIVVHDNCGGGINSNWMLKYLWPTELLQKYVAERLENLPSTYRAVHIRNTDLKTDHAKLLNDLEFAISNRDVLFCTDSGRLQAELKSGMGHDARAHFLTELDPDSNQPLHASSSTTIQSNLEMLADLVALGRAKKLYFSFTQEGRISGFSGLAFAVHCSTFKNRFKIVPKAAESLAKPPVRRSGIVRFLKSQLVIALAKCIFWVSIKVHEAWPNR